MCGLGDSFVMLYLIMGIRESVTERDREGQGEDGFCRYTAPRVGIRRTNERRDECGL